jgi:hypothetical protein
MEFFQPLLNHQTVRVLDEYIYNQPLAHDNINDNLLKFHQNKFWILQLTMAPEWVPPLVLGSTFTYQSNKYLLHGDYPFNDGIKIPVNYETNGNAIEILANEPPLNHGKFLYFPRWTVKVIEIQTHKHQTIIKGQIGNY